MPNDQAKLALKDVFELAPRSLPLSLIYEILELEQQYLFDSESAGLSRRIEALIEDRIRAEEEP